MLQPTLGSLVMHGLIYVYDLLHMNVNFVNQGQK